MMFIPWFDVENVHGDITWIAALSVTVVNDDREQDLREIVVHGFDKPIKTKLLPTRSSSGWAELSKEHAMRRWKLFTRRRRLRFPNGIPRTPASPGRPVPGELRDTLADIGAWDDDGGRVL